MSDIAKKKTTQIVISPTHTQINLWGRKIINCDSFWYEMSGRDDLTPK